jgi:DNA invertase Pin-like site-specific DNA recombinase
MSGKTLGYARDILGPEDFSRQLLALEAAGCSQIFSDIGQLPSLQREGLLSALTALAPGDVLVVCEVYYISRSIEEAVEVVARLDEKQALFRTLTDPHEASLYVRELHGNPVIN